MDDRPIALMGRSLNVVGELSGDTPTPAAEFKNVIGRNLVAGRLPTYRPFRELVGLDPFKPEVPTDDA